jgi:hypothetical protein
MSRLLGGLFAATLLISITSATATAAPAQVNAVPPAPAGFTTVWSDDFDGAAGTPLDTGAWRYDVGPGSSFGTGEIEDMTNSTANVFHDGAGHLVLRALHSGTNPTAGWTSGRVETQADGFGAQAGGVVRMQASIQQPNVTTANGAGYWPAFWMLGAPLRIGIPWPGSGEVDILEDVNGRSSTFGTLHCGTNPGGPCNEGTGIGSGERPCGGCQTGYHTYAVEIDRSRSPEQIRWYLDGANFFSLDANRVDATTWSNAVDHAYFIIFDLAMGGAFPAAFGGGPNAATASGGQMNIDYVAVYTKPPANSSGPNIAKGKTATASSVESAQFPASNVTDGDITTRWSSAFSDPQWIQVDLGQNFDLNHVTLTWEAAGSKAYNVQTSTNGSSWNTIYTNNNSTGGIQDISTSGTARYVRVNSNARLSAWGNSLYEIAAYGPTSGGGPDPTLLSQGHPATASSTENAGTPASAAVDGNTGTRWSSAFGDPQWIQVDLGATHQISQVVLNWETAFASAYQIQTSANGTDWTTVTTGSGAAGVQTLPVTGSGRYVRVNCTARATQWGDSLWEFQVFGT